MLILAIDTATDEGSVALSRGGSTLGACTFEGRSHARRLVPCIQSLLGQSGSVISDLDVVAVADGPGSFTGLRIGFATALGLRRDVPGLKLVTAPSLAALACGLGRKGVVAGIYDALRGEVFAAVYDFDGSCAREVLPPTVTTMQALIADQEPANVAAGDGACKYRERVLEWTGAEPIDPLACRTAGAEGLAQLVLDGAFVKEIKGLEGFSITYGRLAEAQVRWEAANDARLPHNSG